jgi:hypothetical protein
MLLGTMEENQVNTGAEIQQLTSYPTLISTPTMTAKKNHTYPFCSRLSHPLKFARLRADADSIYAQRVDQPLCQVQTVKSIVLRWFLLMEATTQSAHSEAIPGMNRHHVLFNVQKELGLVLKLHRFLYCASKSFPTSNAST